MAPDRPASVAERGGHTPSTLRAAPVPTTEPPRSPLLRAVLVTALGLATVTAVASWLVLGSGLSAALSLVFGAALGYVFQRGRFCFFCIFRDLIEHKDSTGMYAVLTALAVGGIGYALVLGMFVPDPGGGRLPPQAHIGPVSWALVLGGLAFGIGMALAGACVSGLLYRLGEGYLRAVPALLGTLVGFGLGFATWNWLWSATIVSAPTPWLPSTFGHAGALALHLVVLGALALLLLRWLPARVRAESSGPRRDLRDILGEVLVRRWPPGVTGAVVGAIGVGAYLRVEPLGVTAQLGSISRTVLTGSALVPERLTGLDTLAGCATVVAEAILDNGWFVIGFVLAALVAAVAAGRFQPSLPSLSSAAKAALGGVAMGWGAMVSLGCTVGVLLSGISAFALSGWVFFAACFAGVWLGIRLGLHRD